MRGGPLEKGECVWFEPEEGVRFEATIKGYGEFPRYLLSIPDGPFWMWLGAVADNAGSDIYIGPGADALAGGRGVPRMMLTKRHPRHRDKCFLREEKKKP